ncbi:MAG: hypothetical protein HRT44_03545 [Bdellovibrionales bacterium]|nr:hypothetical protein [Bdellovibrionales bacterium]
MFRVSILILLIIFTQTLFAKSGYETPPVNSKIYISHKNHSLSGDRHFIAKKLWNSFIDPHRINDQQNYKKNHYQQIYFKSIYQILSNPNIFGGSCNAYKRESYRTHRTFPDLGDLDNFIEGCPPHIGNGLEISPKPSSNKLLIKTHLNKACHNLIYPSLKDSQLLPLKENQTINNFLSLLGETGDSAMTLGPMEKVYQLLFPTLPLSAEKRKNLQKIRARLSEKKSSLIQWKAFVFELCQSLDIARIH